MGTLAPPVIREGRLRDQPQPRLSAGDLLLRPFEPADALLLVEAYGDPFIQGWHAPFAA